MLLTTVDIPPFKDFDIIKSDKISCKTIVTDPSSVEIVSGRGNNICLFFNRTRYTENTVICNEKQDEPPIYEGSDRSSRLITGLGWILGFRLGEYIHAGGDGGNPKPKSYVSEGIYNDWSIKHLYFVINDYNKYSNNFIGATYSSSLGNYNVLARLTTMNPTSSGTAATISIDTLFDESFSLKKREYFGPVDIQKLHIQILDPYGRVLNLNNMDISFSLHLACLYD